MSKEIEVEIELTDAICNGFYSFYDVSGVEALVYNDTIAWGLDFKVMKSGDKAWFYGYWYQNKVHTLFMGDYKAIDLETARYLAFENSMLLSEGIDPQVYGAAIAKPPSFKSFALNLYMPHAKWKELSFTDDESTIKVHLSKVFGNRKLDKISLHEINAYLAEIAKTHCFCTASRHLALLSRIFELALGWGVIDRNPCAEIKALPVCQGDLRS